MQFQLTNTSYVLEAALRQSKVEVENYFDNFFNEPIHGEKKVFLSSICNFLLQVFEDTKDFDLSLSTVYNTLRTIQFINQKDNQNE